jgi:hypothetical protein
MKLYRHDSIIETSFMIISYMHEGKTDNRIRETLCSTTKRVDPSNFNGIYYNYTNVAINPR